MVNFSSTELARRPVGGGPLMAFHPMTTSLYFSAGLPKELVRLIQ
jgi:hypothetical protein